MKKKRILLAAISIIVISSLLFFILSPKAASPDKPNPSPEASSEKPESTASTPPEFDKNRYSITDPTSIWVVVNKKRPLPDGYAPADLVNGQLRAEAQSHLNELLTAAQNDGLPLSILSAYRSQSTQAATYNGYVAKDGVAEADTYSARPRYSEHQTGLAVDLGNGVCNLETCFGNTPAGQWLNNNSHLYGFIIRYQKGKEAITGYQFEPWHLRYVGPDLAMELFKNNSTMEEFFGLEPAAQY
jgi:D-alanyl-D-alanine carboxypeptidase